MHERNHDIKNSDGRKYNNDLITVYRNYSIDSSLPGVPKKVSHVFKLFCKNHPSNKVHVAVIIQ